MSFLVLFFSYEYFNTDLEKDTSYSFDIRLFTLQYIFYLYPRNKHMDDMDEDTTDISKDTSSKSTTTVSSKCKICGAPALYKYFGVISCHACKIFFKRNAETGLVSSNEYPFFFILY